MKFFRQYARFIVPLPWLFLAATKAWEAMHGMNNTSPLLPFAYVAVAFMFYLGQRKLHQEGLRKKTA